MFYLNTILYYKLKVFIDSNQLLTQQDINVNNYLKNAIGSKFEILTGIASPYEYTNVLSISAVAVFRSSLKGSTILVQYNYDFRLFSQDKWQRFRYSLYGLS